MTTDIQAQIAEILAGHRTLANGPGDCVCACDRTWRLFPEYREHLAEQLAGIVREAQVGALEDAADYWPMSWPAAGHEWLRDRAAKVRSAK